MSSQNTNHDQPIVIALAADLGYQVQVETLIKSLSYHHRHLKIYLFYKDFPIEWFDGQNQRLAPLSSQVIPVLVKGDFTKYALGKYITEVTFYRYFISCLDEQRVLYLDSDIVVDGDLSSLYWQDFAGVPLLAVEDYVHQHLPVYQDLTFESYFNAGVLLIDNAFWRRHATFDDLIAINDEYPNLVFGDQDALNIYFNDSWRALPIEYNYQVGALIELSVRRGLNELVKTSGYLDVVPKIIHYTGPYKPWKASVIHEMQIATRKKYWFYHDLSWQEIYHQQGVMP